MNSLNSFKFVKFVSKLWLAVALPAAAAVSETPYEFTTTGDFDGDSRPDLVIVDRATGNYRIAYQLAAGQYTWAKPRGSGIEGVTGVSAGKLFQATRDALAFTGPEANRVNLVEADNTAVAGQPISIFPAGVGPSVTLALDIGGPGNTALDDFLIGTIYNNGLLPSQLHLVRNNAAVFTPISTTFLNVRPVFADVAKPKNTGSQMGAFFLRNVNSPGVFRVYNFSSGAPVQVLEQTGLLEDTRCVHASFDGSAYAQFVFYQPRHTNSQIQVLGVQEPVPSQLSFATSLTFDLGLPIDQIIVLSGTTAQRLLVIFDGGSVAGVYDFNGLNPPTLIHELNPPPGEKFSGAAPLRQLGLMMFSAAAGQTHSTGFQSHTWNGTGYQAGAAGQLPGLNELSAAANVFQFEFEPFVKSAPRLLRSLNSGDWSSSLNLAALPLISATVENFVDSEHGLDNPSIVNLGNAHPQTHFGLVNQYAPPLSLFSATRPVGDEIAEVTITPPGGTYPACVKASLSSPTPAVQILYRRNHTGQWLTYSAPFTIFQDTTVSYYAKGAGNPKSIIRHATYQFTTPPSELDSDGDGVPDYVEAAKGLDPAAGPDSDGDGFSDLDELLQNTDPNDPNNFPANESHIEQHTGFDLVASPRPLDGTANTLTVCSNDTSVNLHTLPGGHLKAGFTEVVALPVINPAAWISNIVVDTKQRLLAVSTDQHFNIVTAGADKALGRELLGIIPVPAITHNLVVPYQYQGGNLATEAANWISAAQTAQNAIPHEVRTGELSMDSTLTALLAEKKISEILLSRGVGDANNITLFPFRPTDNTRKKVTASALLDIEALGANGEPAFRLQTMHHVLSNSLPAELRNVTAEIYGISSALNNADLGMYPSPVDTLRNFIATGILHSNYLAQTALTQNDLASAHATVAPTLANVPPRPTAMLTLLIRPDTFGADCTLLDLPLGQATRSLYAADGRPFRLLENFQLPPGSEIHVFAFTDLPNLGCGDAALEVIGLGLDGVPAPSPIDSDGDLLLDELELLLFGSLNQNGNGDFDGDGIPNLQEFWDGTDPADKLSKPINLANLTPPQINIQPAINGQFVLTWFFPEPYASKINFTLLSTDALGQPFTPIPAAIQDMGGGNFQIVLPNPGSAVKFYVFQLTLK
jgi:hypothetical protein